LRCGGAGLQAESSTTAQDAGARGQAPHLPVRIAIHLLLKPFPVGHFLIGALFFVGAFALIAFAGMEMWDAHRAAGRAAVFAARRWLLGSVALLTIAVAALELGQTIFEE